MAGINYKALAAWEEKTRAKNKRWYERRGEEVPDTFADDFGDHASALEALRLSAKIKPLSEKERAHLEGLIDAHGIACVLRTLHLLAFQKEQAILYEAEFSLETADPRPWHEMADKLDELAGGRIAAECIQVTTGEAEPEGAL